MPDDRRWDHLVVAPAAAPQLAAVSGIVRHAPRWLFTMISSWSPARMAIGVPQPTLASRLVRHSVLAGARVEGGDERAGELILIEDDSIAVHQRRPGGSVVRVHRPESRCQTTAVQIEGHESLAAERRVHAARRRSPGAEA